jgi:hypothetical protein
MTNPEILESTLANLAELEIQLINEGGPEENGLLFEEILAYQEEILTSFGLPISPIYQDIVSFNTIPTASDIKEIITQLKIAAIDYLSANAKTDLHILQEAIEAKNNPMDVFPEIGIATHTYTTFVYNMILLRGKDSVENVLQDLRHCNQPEILNALGQIVSESEDLDPEISEFLNASGIKYLNQFIIHNSNLLTDDDY